MLMIQDWLRGKINNLSDWKAFSENIFMLETAWAQVLGTSIKPWIP